MAISNLNMHILSSLKTSDMYGLEIIKAIEKETDGKVIIKQPSLYSALRRLEQKGYINSFWEDSDIGGKRHYYSLTDEGKRYLKSETAISQPQVKEVADITPPKKEDKEPEAVFAAYVPEADTPPDIKSFSETMREYIEPEIDYPEYKLESTDTPIKQPVITNVENTVPDSPTPTKQEITPPDQPRSSFPTPPIAETTVEFTEPIIKPKKEEDINYKDILGELDADLSPMPSLQVKEPQFELKQEFATTEKPVQSPERSKYTQQVAEILLSSKSGGSNRAISTINNEDTLEEINRRYTNMANKKNYSKNVPVIIEEPQPHYIKPNKVGFSNVKQENIIVKPYNNSPEPDYKDKKFVDVNRLHLTQSIIMTLLMGLEIGLLYFFLNRASLVPASQSYIYIVCAVIIAVYFVCCLLANVRNIDKKISTKDIGWGMNLFYRVMVFAILLTFVISLNLFLGMAYLNEPQFLNQWLIPSVMICNLLLSWLIGVFLYKIKAFHV